MSNLYADIAKRTGGDIYIGVVGPVRTGKSTLIKRLMEELVIPNIEDLYRKERAKDELPQSGSGKTIMTAEPKFIPEEAVQICPDGAATLSVRLIDSVGYMVDGAVGAYEDGTPRMVTTPWFDYEIPMTDAAELGTKKVMQEHCSIGLVVTTDGTVTDIPRQDYIAAEKRAIEDMKATGKPFLVIVNSKDPGGEAAGQVRSYLKKAFDVDAVSLDCQALDKDGINRLLQELLYAFPMQELRVYMPRWMDALEPEHSVKAGVYEGLLQAAQQIGTLGQAKALPDALGQIPQVQDATVRGIDLGTGSVECTLSFPEAMYYEILSDRAGIPISSDAQLIGLLTELTAAKQEYDKISDALNAARATGYGVVMPTAGEMTLEAPQLLKKGSAYGVKLKAGAPSIHMIRVDIDTEISPIVGSEQQSQDLVQRLSEQDTAELWDSNIFGKSVYELIQEGITSKLLRTPEEVRTKFRGSLCRIVNEGASGLICLIL